MDDDEIMDRDNDNTIEYDTSSLTSVIGRMTKAILEIPEDVVEEIRELPDTLITPDNLEFKIKMSDKPEVFNVYFICEAASRVLFETVRWTRSVQVIQVQCRPQITVFPPFKSILSYFKRQYIVNVQSTKLFLSYLRILTTVL